MRGFSGDDSALVNERGLREAKASSSIYAETASSNSAFGRGRTCAVVVCRRKRFLPEGIRAKGTGASPGRALKFFDSSQTRSRGSRISVCPCQKAGERPH